jgi:hypothetical protein
MNHHCVLPLGTLRATKSGMIKCAHKKSCGCLFYRTQVCGTTITGQLIVPIGNL